MLQISIRGELKGWKPWLEVLMSRTMRGNTATVVLMSWDRWEKTIATAETLPCNSEE